MNLSDNTEVRESFFSLEVKTMKVVSIYSKRFPGAYDYAQSNETMLECAGVTLTLVLSFLLLSLVRGRMLLFVFMPEAVVSSWWGRLMRFVVLKKPSRRLSVLAQSFKTHTLPLSIIMA